VLFVVAFLVILGGVCWSAYVAWHGLTPATTASIALEFIVTPDPALRKRLPLLVRDASLIIAVRRSRVPILSRTVKTRSVESNHGCRLRALVSIPWSRDVTHVTRVQNCFPAAASSGRKRWTEADLNELILRMPRGGNIVTR